MPNSASSAGRRIPKYRRHSSGQAVVTLNKRPFYLGKYGTDASKKEYARLIQKWIVNGYEPPPRAGDAPTLTVSELLSLYLRHAKRYYRNKRGEPTDSLHGIKQAMRPLRRLYGDTAAAKFSPLDLKAVRQSLIDLRWTPAEAKKDEKRKKKEPPATAAGPPTRRLSRGTINKRIDTVKRIFRWGVGEELVPPAVLEALEAVDGLKKGRTEAPEGKKVKPANEAAVEATLAELSPTVANMIRLQQLTGCRPGEICILRPGDVDRSGEIWEYVPDSHKTEHQDKERIIFIGPQAQEILRPYLLRGEGVFCFSPRETADRHNARRRASRKTPMTPSQAKRRPKRRPRRSPGNRYTTESYRRAIHRACDRAGVPRWSPNRLRHSAGTKIRRKYGLEASQVVLGHAKADVTQVYAERDFELARRIVREVG